MSTNYKIITLTSSAVKRLSEIMANNKQALGIRIGIKKSGCAGMEYTFDLVTEINPKDDRVDTEITPVFIAPEATLFLLGAELDFQVTKFKSGFVFNNPNQVSVCGCGESVQLNAADLARVHAFKNAQV